MQKLRAFIEERRIVLVSFDDEVLASTQRKAAAEILRNSAYQEIWLSSGALEDPCQHRRCRRLPVRSCNDNHISLLQKFIMQKLRHRLEWNSLIQHILQFHIPARHRIPHNHQVRPWFQVLLGKRLCHGDSERRQEIRHWRVCRRVRTRHPEPACLQHAGQRRHCSSANSDQVNVFWIAHLYTFCPVLDRIATFVSVALSRNSSRTPSS